MSAIGLSTETGTTAAESARPALFARLSWAAVAFGIGAYLIHYFGARSLWLDEAMLALNILHLSPGELAGKLDYNQLAPVGWLYLERASYNLLGSLEHGLRLVSLLAAIGAMVLFRNLAFAVLRPVGAFCATLIMAFSGPLLRYAAEAKPYILDAFLAVAIMAAAFSILRSERLSARDAVLLGAVGLIAVLTSFSAVYVLAAAGGAILIRFALQRRFAAAGVVAGIAAVWLAVFAALLLRVYFPQLSGSDLVEGGASNFFARTAYAPLPPTSLSDIAWYAGWLERFFDFLFQREGWFPMAALIGFGAVASLRRDWPLLAMSLGPVAIALVVSSLHIFPAFERLLLFSAPGLILLAGAGAAFLTTLSRGSPAAALTLALVVAAGSGGYIFGNLFKMKPPFAQQDIVPALDILKAEYQPGDVVYVANMTLPAWLTYRDRYGLDDVSWKAGRLPMVSWPCAVKDLAMQGDPGRYWVLMVYNEPQPNPEPAQVSAIMAEFGREARLTEVLHEDQVFLYRAEIEARAEPGEQGVADQLCTSDGRNNNFATPERMKERLSLD